MKDNLVPFDSDKDILKCSNVNLGPMLFCAFPRTALGDLPVDYEIESLVRMKTLSEETQFLIRKELGLALGDTLEGHKAELLKKGKADSLKKEIEQLKKNLAILEKQLEGLG